MNLRWDEISLDHMVHLDKVFQLYDQTMHKEVREPHDILLKGLEEVSGSLNKFHLMIGLIGEEVVSFAAFHYLAEVNTGFIVYLITSPNVRSKGIGSITLEKIEEMLQFDAVFAGYDSLTAIILETEKEELAHSKQEKVDCQRRNRFYLRNGFKHYSEINYMQPPLNGEILGVPLNLFIKEISENINWIRHDVAKIIQAMYREKYFFVNGIDSNVLNDCLKNMNL